MKKMLFCFVLFALVVTAAEKNVKLAQTGFKFLNVLTDPRFVGMGEAATAIEGTSSSLFFNPASMARMQQWVQTSFGSTQWIADINHVYGSIAISTPNNDYGVFGFTVQSVDYGDLDRTIRTNSNAEGYLDLGTFSPVAFSMGVGYAYALSDRFSVGGRVSYAMQDLGEGFKTIDGNNNNPVAAKNSASTYAFDFGMFYKTGIKDLNFAVSVKNFSQEVKYQREGFQLPLTFRIGLSANVMNFIGEEYNTGPLLLSVDATNSRDYPETINMGTEYIFLKAFAFRAGYKFGQDEQGFSAGIGIQQSYEQVGIGVDYSYSQFGIFGNINRFAVQFYF